MHKDLREVHFRHSPTTGPGLEVVTLHELARRIPAGWRTPDRPDFYVLVFVRRGKGKHMVDFHEYDTCPGSVLLIRPGQVQRWTFSDSQSGYVLILTKEVVAPSVSRAALDMRLVAFEHWATSSTLRLEKRNELFEAISRLQRDVLQYRENEVGSALIQHELLSLLLRLVASSDVINGIEPSAETNPVYHLFRKELEKSFSQRVTSLEVASRLGYSERTLSRACLSATGKSVKALIDDRIALEAKRLLAHSDLSIHEVGHNLGFSEPTNFIKFFRRKVKSTPQSFRIEVQSIKQNTA